MSKSGPLFKIAATLVCLASISLSACQGTQSTSKSDKSDDISSYIQSIIDSNKSTEKSEPPVQEYTVNFVTYTSESIPSQKIKEGGLVVRPTDPFQTGKRFDGWYKESSFETLYDFDTPVTSSFTLYAKFNQLYTVTFMVDGATYTANVYAKGEAVTKPNDPVKDGYTFLGWYTDKNATDNLYDFDTAVSKDLTLYAGFKDSHVHTFADTYESNDQTHWHPSTCGHDIKGDEAPHSWVLEEVVEATYVAGGYTKYKCEVCGREDFRDMTPELEHRYATTYSSDETGHWYACIDEGWTYLQKDFEQHEFRDEVVDPTETEDGYTLHTCKKCGYETKDTIVPHPVHTYSDTFETNETHHWHKCLDEGFEDLKKDYGEHTFIDEVKEPTFDQFGYTAHTCTVCNYTYTDNFIQPIEHNYALAWSTSEAEHWHACTDEGYEGLYIDKAEHDFEVSTVPATEDSQGYDVHRCATCGYEFKDNYTDIAGLEYATEWSHDDDYHWHACVTEGHENAKGSLAEHDITVTTVNPTYEHGGYTEYACSTCGYSYQIDVQDPLQHSYSDLWTYNNDKHWHECMDAGYEDLKFDEANHVWELTSSEESTYYSQGYEEYTCSVCGATKHESLPFKEHTFGPEWLTDRYNHWHPCLDEGFEDSQLNVESHDFDTVDVPATFEDGAYTIYTCKVCGYSYESAHGAALSHNYSDEWSHDETNHWKACVDEGYTDLKIYETNHDYSVEYVSPTDNDEGYTQYTCNTCGYSYKTDIVPPLNPDYLEYADEWSFDEATHWHQCITEGYLDRLGDYEEHNFVDDVTAPTYEAGGYTTHTCSDCGYSYVDSYTDQLQHNWSSTTSYDETYHWIACIDEGYEDLTINKEAHNFENVTYGATYDNPGYIQHLCVVCGYMYNEETEAQLEHHYSEEWTQAGAVHYHACIDPGYSDLYKDYAAHDYQFVRVVAPTYDEEGYTLSVCVCGAESRTDYTSQLQHNFSSDWESNRWYHWHVCLDDGYSELLGDEALHTWDNGEELTATYEHGGGTRYTCTVCGYSYIQNETSPLEHNYSNSWSVDLEKGTHYHACIDEGYEDLRKGEASHWYDTVDYPATYQEGAQTLYSCSICHYYYYETTSDPLQHNFYEAWDYNDEGHFHHCSDSGYSSVISEVEPHTYEITSQTDPTYDMVGGIFRRCTVCGKETFESIPKLQHSYSEDWSYGTTTHYHACIDDGYTSLKADEAAHTYTDEVTGPATFEHGEVVTHTCSVCGYSYDTYEGDALTHNYSTQWSVGASTHYHACTDEGYESLKADEEAHSFGDWTINQQPGERTDGEKEHTCSVCGFTETVAIDSFEKQTLALLTLTADDVDNPTCYTITSMSSSSLETLVLPSTYNGLPVKYIAERAFRYNSNIKKVIIPASIITIGEYAFHWTSLEEIEFEANSQLERIENFAFYDNSSLACDIVLPNSVTYLGTSAFARCPNIPSVTLSSNLTSIGASAFYEDNLLTSIVIPSTVQSIGDGAFTDCTNVVVVVNLSNLNIVAGETYGGKVAEHALVVLTSADDIGSIVTSGDFVIYRCPTKSYLLKYNGTATEITIPEEVTYICADVFKDKTAITSISMSNNVTTIDANAFSGCTNLATLTLSTALTTIKEAAFKNCTSLATAAIASTVTSIGREAFRGTAITSVTLPVGLTSLDEYAFGDCASLTTINWNSRTFTKYGDSYSPFYGSAVTTIVFGNTVQDIPADAIYGLDNVTSITLGTGIVTIGGSAFAGAKISGTLTFASGLTTVGNDAFARCVNLEGVVFPATVETMGYRVFDRCESLVSITIPFVGRTATETSSTMGHILNYIDTDSKRVLVSPTSGSQYHAPSSLRTITVLGGNINASAFEGLSMVTTINLPNDLTSIGARAFKGCTNLQSANISNTVETIGTYAFDSCTSLLEITFPSSLLTLGTNAFYQCTGVKTVNWNTNISNVSLYGLNTIETVNIGANVTSIPANLFSDKTTITTVNIDPSNNVLSNIGYSAFSNCSSLTSITLPSSCLTIGGYAFAGCTLLASINLENVTLIGNGVFQSCAALTSVNLSGLTNIPAYGFKDASSLTSVTFNSGLLEIQEQAFSGADLSSVAFGDSVTLIGASAFKNNTHLESVTFPSGISNVSAGSFEGCVGLTSISFGGGIPLAVAHLFGTDQITGTYVVQDPQYPYTTYYVPTTLVSVSINGGTIADQALYGLSTLTSVSVTGTLANIGSYAFTNVSGLTSISISGSSTIGASAFAGCTDLVRVNSETDGVFDLSGILTIGNDAFSGVTGIQTLTFNTALTSIGERAFKNCYQIGSIDVKSSTVTIGASAFSGCYGLTSLTIGVIPNGGLLYAFGEADTAMQSHMVEINMGAKYHIPTNLTNITLLNTTVGYRALYRMSTVETVTLPAGVTAIGESAFDYCTSLTTINLPDTIVSIGENAFNYCISLVEVVLPEELTSIGNGAFSSCNSLAKITVNEKLTTIGTSPQAFYGCMNLVAILNNSQLEITLGADTFGYIAKYALKVTSDPLDIGTVANENGYLVYSFTESNVQEKYIIANVSNNTGVIPSGITGIRPNAFNGNTTITELTIGADVKFIGSGAFHDMTALATVHWNTTQATVNTNGALFSNSPISLVTIGEGAKVIPAYSFSNLGTINATDGLYVPSSILDIAGTAFNDTTIAAIHWNAANATTNTFRNKTTITSVIIGADVVTLPSQLFENCTGIASVEWRATGFTNPTVDVDIFNGCTHLATLTFASTLTSIPSFVFKGITSLTSITLPTAEGFTAIPEYAFSYDSGLTSISIPSSVTSIGNSAFEGCSVLVRINSANSDLYNLTNIINIGTDAFKSTGMIAVNIASSVKSIGNGAFSSCTSLTTIIWDTDLTTALTSQSELFKNSYNGDSEHPNNISVTFGSHATTVPYSLFYSIANLTSVDLGSIQIIEASAFFNTGITSLTVPSSVTSLANTAFNDCHALTTLCWDATSSCSFGANNHQSPFDNCSHLATVTFGEHATYIHDYLLYDISALSSVTIANTVVTIGQYAFANEFAGKASLTSITFEDNPTLATISAHAFENCSYLTSITIPASVATIGESAFEACYRVATLTFASGSQACTIATHAFAVCATLASIVIPDRVTYIGEGAFINCFSLTSITLPFTGSNGTNQENEPTHFYHIFKGFRSSTTGFSLPDTYASKYIDSVQYYYPTGLITVEITSRIYEKSFYQVTTIKNVTLGSAITTIPSYAFSGTTALERINSTDTDPTHKEVNLTGIVSIKAHAFSGCSQVNMLTLSNSITEIKPESLGFANVTELYVPDSMATYEAGYLTGLDGLVTLNIPQIVSTSVTTASASTLFGVLFEDISTLNSGGVVQSYDTYPGNLYDGHSVRYNIPSTLRTVTVRGGNFLFGTFSGCSQLTSINITLSQESTALADYLFYECSGLTSFTIPNNITSIGNRTFGRCYGLANVTFGTGLVSIGQDAFENCNSITSIDLDNGALTTIGICAFGGTGITSLTIPNRITSIGEFAFSDCDELSSVSIGIGVSSIPYGCFTECSKLASLTIVETDREGTISIEQDAFLGTAFVTLTIPEYVSSIGYQAFAGISTLESITVNASSIGERAFAGNKNLRTVTIGANVTNIHSDAFSGTTPPENDTTNGITTLTLNATNLTSANAVFSGQDVNSITIGSGVTRLPDYVFSGCSGVTTLVIPTTVTYIGEGALKGCSSLSSLTLPFIGASENQNNAAYRHVFGAIFGIDFDGIDQNYNSTLHSHFDIPSTLQTVILNQNVASIGYGAFNNCSNIVSITLPTDNSITSIGERAFEGCSSLAKLNCGNSNVIDLTGITDISNKAFKNCTSITDVLVNADLTRIGDWTFTGCTALSKFNSANAHEINIPSKVTYIGEEAFKDIGTFTSLVFAKTTLGENETGITIGECAFKGFSAITTFTVPDSVVSLGRGAFSGWSSLQTLSVKFIGSGDGTSDLFGYIFGTLIYTGSYEAKQYTSATSQVSYYIPTALTSITVRNATSIPFGAFSGMNIPATFNLPANYTSVGGYAFAESNITSIVIPDTVMTIGENAFARAASLQSITLPFVGNGTDDYFFTYLFDQWIYNGTNSSDPTIYYNCSGDAVPYSLTSITITGGSIGENSFYDLESVVTINIPTNITSIPNRAFYGCTSLVNINSNNGVSLPSGITSIGDEAFYQCASITEFTIGVNVTSIGRWALSHMSELVTIHWNSTSTWVDNNESTYGGNQFYNMFDGCSKLTEVVFGADVTRIPDYAFNYAHLTTVDMSNITAQNVTIGDYAFSKTNIVEITIGSTVVTIGDYAFWACSNLRSIDIPASITSIEDTAFSGCNILVEIINHSSIGINRATSNNGDIGYNALNVVATRPADNNRFSSDDDFYYYSFGEEKYILRYLGDATSVTIPSDVTGILRNAFYDKALTTVTLPTGLKHLEPSAFAYCQELTTVNWNATAILDETISGVPFNACTQLTTLNIGSGVTRIPAYAFSGVTSLTTINIDANNTVLVEIGSYAFRGCTGLPSTFELPSTLTTIRSGAFEGCTGLDSITIGANVSIINENAFKGIGEISNLTWNSTVAQTSLTYGSDVFKNTTPETITIGSSVVYVPELGIYLRDDTGVKYLVYNAVNASASFSGYKFLTITIGNSVTHIPESAFAYCHSVTSINLPDSVTTISQSAFQGTTHMTTFTIGADSQLATVGRLAFAHSGITEFIIPSSLTSLAYNAFMGSSLHDIEINSATLLNSVIDIQEQGDSVDTHRSLFSYSNIENVTLGSNITAIPDYTFFFAYHLESVTFEGEVLTIGTKAFCTCPELTSITLPSTVTTIGDNAFEYYNTYTESASKLASITLSSALTTIGNSAFANCTALTSITIPSNVSSYGTNVFSGCTSLATVTWNAPTVANSAFDSVTSITSVTLGSSVTTIGTRAFFANRFTSITLPSGLTSIGSDAFHNCSQLSSIIIPDSIVTIGANAFEHCTGMGSVSLPDVTHAVNVGNYAFKECTALTSINIPGRYTLGDYVFNNCSILATTTFGKDSGNIVLGNNVFNLCGQLNRVYIPEDVVTIGQNISSNSANIVVYCEHNEKQNGWANNWIGSDAVVIYSAVENNWFVESNAEYYITDSTLDEEKVALARYRGSGELVIGDTVTHNNKAYTITSICDNACINKTAISGLTIGDEVLTIGENAFSGCSGIHNLTIGSKVQTIGDYAFKGCTGITSLTMPASVTTMTYYAFNGCTGIQTVVWNAETIPSSMFSGRTSLSSVTFGAGVRTIGVRAFYGCTALAGISIPSTITSIQEQAFMNCTNLVNVTFLTSDGNPNLTLGDSIFMDDTSILRFYIPSRITSLTNTSLSISNSHNSYLVIYCEAATKPDGWNQYWMPANATVMWGISSFNSNSYFDVDGFEGYITGESTAKLVKYRGDATEITIGNSSSKNVINGYTITDIQSNVISNYYTVTKITIYASNNGAYMHGSFNNCYHDTTYAFIDYYGIQGTAMTLWNQYADDTTINYNTKVFFHDENGTTFSGVGLKFSDGTYAAGSKSSGENFEQFNFENPGVTFTAGTTFTLVNLYNGDVFADYTLSGAGDNITKDNGNNYYSVNANITYKLYIKTVGDNNHTIYFAA